MLNLRDAIRGKRLCLRCQVLRPGDPERGPGPCPACGDEGLVGDDPPAGEVGHLLGAASLPELLARLTEAISDCRQQEMSADTVEGIIIASGRRSGLAMAALGVQSLILRKTMPVRQGVGT